MTSLPLLEIVPTAASTMDEAADRIRSGAVDVRKDDLPSSLGVLALEQTHGRGQRGRTWQSSAGASLTVTYYIPVKSSDRRGMLSLLTGIAVMDALSAAALASSGADFGLKWPNDVLLNGRKAAGILIETATDAAGTEFALVGVGVNIGRMPFTAAIAAASLEADAAAAPDPEALGVSIGEGLWRWLRSARTTGWDAVRQAWEQRQQTYGRKYESRTERGLVIGAAVGIDSDGALIIETPNRLRISVSSASALREQPAAH